MDWITLYVKGRVGFKAAVLARLREVVLHGSSQLDQDVLMVWVKGSKSVRSIKLMIGADTIFRYRLRFFTDLNEHLETNAVGNHRPLSVRESELLQKMRERTKTDTAE
jgi:hypothetical protein